MINTSRGSGSLRQRRPGVWELRVALGPDLVSGRSLVRSVTVHGDRDDAQAALQRWAAQAEVVRGGRRAAPGIAVADLLERWVAAAHGWRPATVVGYLSVVRALRVDPIGARRASQVVRAVVRAPVQAWTSAGVGSATIAAGAMSTLGVRLGDIARASWTRRRWGDAGPVDERDASARSGRGGSGHPGCRCGRRR